MENMLFFRISSLVRGSYHLFTVVIYGIIMTINIKPIDSEDLDQSDMYDNSVVEVFLRFFIVLSIFDLLLNFLNIAIPNKFFTMIFKIFSFYNIFVIM